MTNTMFQGVHASRLPLIESYIHILKTENEKTNVYSKKAYEHLPFHIQDSIYLANIITDIGQDIIDMGSGSGLPSVILAICNPHQSITAIESRGKKCRFLELVQSSLSLENLTVVNMDIHQYIRENSPAPSVITAKAFAPYDKAIHIAQKIATAAPPLWIPISALQFSTLSLLDLPNITLHTHPSGDHFYLEATL